MTCAVDGCEGEVLARGLCGRDYQRWRKYGDPTHVQPNLGNRTPRVLPKRRTCIDCGFQGPRDKFPVGRNVCKPCQRERQAAWTAANPEKVAASLARQIASGSVARGELRRRTRILAVDLETVTAYRETHAGRCDICGGVSAAGRDLSIDHCATPRAHSEDCSATTATAVSGCSPTSPSGLSQRLRTS